MERTVGFFTDLGIPFPAANAAFIARLEFYGGMLLIVGLGTRIVASLLGSTMVVALMTADKEALPERAQGRRRRGPHGRGAGRVRALPALADPVRPRPREPRRAACGNGSRPRRTPRRRRIDWRCELPPGAAPAPEPPPDERRRRLRPLLDAGLPPARAQPRARLRAALRGRAGQAARRLRGPAARLPVGQPAAPPLRARGHARQRAGRRPGVGVNYWPFVETPEPPGARPGRAARGARVRSS